MPKERISMTSAGITLPTKRKAAIIITWIKLYSQQHTGNPYPTHGLGPICQWMDIHRGDRMEYLVSMSSREAGLSAYARGQFGKHSAELHNLI